MRARSGLFTATSLGMLMILMYRGFAQQSPPPADAQRPAGGFVPGQTRPPIPASVVARGKTLFGVNCQGCHGQDLRGGDLGGPNLLRSQVALSDQNGELIVPIIQGSRQKMGMPAIGLNLEDSMTVAAYVRSVIGTIGRQGAPPGEQKALNVVVGDAAAGESYFVANCKGCHSPEGDLRGIASRVGNPKTLQNLWIAGGTHNSNGDGPSSGGASVAKVTVTPAPGASVEGELVHIDDFLVTLKLHDGTSRSFERKGTVPRVVLHDPLKAHKELLSVYTDKDIHNLTAYLVTLK